MLCNAFLIMENNRLVDLLCSPLLEIMAALLTSSLAADASEIDGSLIIFLVVQSKSLPAHEVLEQIKLGIGSSPLTAICPLFDQAVIQSDG